MFEEFLINENQREEVIENTIKRGIVIPEENGQYPCVYVKPGSKRMTYMKQKDCYLKYINVDICSCLTTEPRFGRSHSPCVLIVKDKK